MNEFYADVSADLGPRSTVIVLGDARTNGRPPAEDVLRPGRRPRQPHLLAQPQTGALLELRRFGDERLHLPRRRLPCWKTEHLEQFVDVVASGKVEHFGTTTRKYTSGHRY